MWFIPTQQRSRLMTFLFCSLIALFVAGFVAPPLQTAYAQEKDANAPAPPDPPADPPRSKNIVIHILSSVGWFFGTILGLISVGLMALVVLMAMDMRMGAAIPPGFVEDFTDTVNKRRFKEAYEMSRQDNSFLARVLTTGMSRLQYGIEDARESAFNMVESIRSSKEQLITYVGTIGTLGPLIGLVGTVYGMIRAFMRMAISGGRPDFLGLVDDISHALVITMIGVGIAVPAIFCHAFFKNRLIRITNDTSNLADDLLTQMYHNSKRPAGTAAPSSPVAETRSSTAAIKSVE